MFDAVSAHLWLTFALTYAAFSAIPGPSVMMAIGQTLSHGKSAGLRCVAGDLMGGAAMMSLGFAGLGSVLALSQTGFDVVKWAGVAYLIYLGVQKLRLAGHEAPAPDRGFRSGLLVGLLNPTAKAFFIAVTAQFIDPALPAAPQFVILGGTAMTMAGLVLCLYVALAGWIGQKWATPRARRRVDQLGGSAMIGGGILVALRG